MLSRLVDAVYRGACNGSLYALLAMGLNLPFATTKTFNFAHGELMILGSMGGVILWTSFGLPVGLALVTVVVGAALVGAITERIAVRPFAGDHDSSGWVLSTFGVFIIMSSVLTILVTRKPGSSDTRFFPDFLPVTEPFRAGGVVFEPRRLFLIVVMIVVAVALWVFQHRTRFGHALGAVADDREGALLRGLPVRSLAMASYAIGGAIAALTGFVAGPVTQATLGGGFALTLGAFIAATVGGIPKMSGAIVGGLLLGVLQQMTAEFADAQLTSTVSLALLLVVLALRPEGLFVRKVRTV